MPTTKTIGLVAAPEHNASFFVIYELPRSLEIGSAYTYIGERMADITNRTEIPGYCTIDLFVRWRVSEQLSLTINLNNLLDKEHYESGYSASTIVPGPPRNFKLTTNLKF